MEKIHALSALILIDVQNDFCPSYTEGDGRVHPEGALAVPRGNEVIGPLNSLSVRFAAAGAKVIATQDWHPAGHVSFASAHREEEKPGDGGILWPDHCVQGSRGAALHGLLNLNPVHFIIRKGFRKNMDSYSAFFENDRRTSTGLGALLQGLGITEVFLGGLATDYCVLYSALDALKLGFKSVVLRDAVRGVGSPAGSIESAFETMDGAGVRILESAELPGGAG